MSAQREDHATRVPRRKAYAVKVLAEVAKDQGHPPRVYRQRAGGVPQSDWSVVHHLLTQGSQTVKAHGTGNGTTWTVTETGKQLLAEGRVPSDTRGHRKGRSRRKTLADVAKPIVQPTVPKLTHPNKSHPAHNRRRDIDVLVTKALGALTVEPLYPSELRRQLQLDSRNYDALRKRLRSGSDPFVFVSSSSGKLVLTARGLNVVRNATEAFNAEIKVEAPERREERKVEIEEKTDPGARQYEDTSWSTEMRGASVIARLLVDQPGKPSGWYLATANIKGPERDPVVGFVRRHFLKRHDTGRYGPDWFPCEALVEAHKRVPAVTAAVATTPTAPVEVRLVTRDQLLAGAREEALVRETQAKVEALKAALEHSEAERRELLKRTSASSPAGPFAPRLSEPAMVALNTLLVRLGATPEFTIDMQIAQALGYTQASDKANGYATAGRQK